MMPGTTDVPVRFETRIPWVTLAVSILLTVVPLVVFLPGDLATREIVVALAAAAVAGYAATVHPRSIFIALALVLGLAPYVKIPNTDVPVLLVLAAGVWVALVFMKGTHGVLGWCELAVLILGILALMSLLATGVSGKSAVEFVTWLTATAVVVPLRLLPDDVRTTTARAFVIGAAAGSGLGILVRMNTYGLVADFLANFGYDPGGDVQYVYGPETTTTRLSGSFVEPNIAGLILAVGVLGAVVYFRGQTRVALVVVISGGLLLTLSRSAIATVVVAAILVMLRSPARRLAVVAAGFLAALVPIAVPVVRTRLFESFGPSDFGTTARVLALHEFPGAMQGHWIWGLGWARPEFRDPMRTINFVANAPLMTIYRGGVVLGAVAIILLLVLVLRSWFAAARSFDAAVLSCGVIGFILVALQLDFPVVLQPPATAVFSLLVALSLAPPSPDRLADRSTHA